MCLRPAVFQSSYIVILQDLFEVYCFCRAPCSKIDKISCTIAKYVDCTLGLSDDENIIIFFLCRLSSCKKYLKSSQKSGLWAEFTNCILRIISISEEKFPVAITKPQHGIDPYYAIITYFPSIIIKRKF